MARVSSLVNLLNLNGRSSEGRLRFIVAQISIGASGARCRLSGDLHPVNVATAMRASCDSAATT
jgi:hypothetical protein